MSDGLVVVRKRIHGSHRQDKLAASNQCGRLLDCVHDVRQVFGKVDVYAAHDDAAQMQVHDLERRYQLAACERIAHQRTVLRQHVDQAHRSRTAQAVDGQTDVARTDPGLGFVDSARLIDENDVPPSFFQFLDHFRTTTEYDSPQATLT